MGYGSPRGPQGGAEAFGRAVASLCYLVGWVVGAGDKTTQETLTDESKDIVCRESVEVCTGEVNVPVSEPADMPASAAHRVGVRKSSTSRLNASGRSK